MMAEKEVTPTVVMGRSDIHWARKIWHMAGVFMIFVIYRLCPTEFVLPLLIATLILFVPLDLLRQKNPKINRMVLKVFGPIMRKGEVDGIAGTTWLIAGVTLVTSFCPRSIVSLALLFLAFADPLASFVGIRFGRIKVFGRKTLEGFLTAYLVCAIATYVFLSTTTDFGSTLIWISLIAGLIGSLAELVPVGKLDDNFTMPVLSAFGLYILFLAFGKL